MKTAFIFFVTLSTFSTLSQAQVSCSDLLVPVRTSYTKNSLNNKNLEEMEGKIVRIRDQNGRRTIEGLVIAAHRSRPEFLPKIYMRVLEKSSNEILLLEYELASKDLKQIDVLSTLSEIQNLADTQSKTFQKVLLVSYGANFDSISRFLDVTKPVRIALSKMDSFGVEILEGILILPSEREAFMAQISPQPLMFKIQTTKGIVDFDQLRIVQIYGQPRSQ